LAGGWQLPAANAIAMVFRINAILVEMPMDKWDFRFPAVHLLIERQAASIPDATAVVFRDIRLSFRELDQRANRLAHWLRSRGVGRETVVALYLERSIDAVVGLLAVLKAGGAYLPLDASFPLARIQAITEEAGTAMILAGPAQAAALPSAYFLDGALTGEPDTAPVSCNQPEDLALVLYTSGSTGTPKGVEITHANLISNIRLWEESHRLSVMGAIAQTAFMSFAVFQSDVFRALSLGLTLVICPPETLLLPGSLLRLLRRERVGFLESVPSLIRLLLHYAQENQQRLEFLREIVISSDRWYVREHRALGQLLAPNARLSHVYGLSETTFDSTWYDGIPAMLSPNDLVPIGHPFPGIRAYILDSALRPISSGEGELYIGGPGVARGYRNRPDLTDERFIFSPSVPGDRLFRTGDLARLLPDGTILLIGRLDRQLKVRGFRVEIGEVEAALEAHPDVRQTVVGAYETPSSENRLVAFYVARRPCDPMALRGFLATRLPEFMVPTAFIAIPAIPLTPSGKIDRSALIYTDTLRSNNTSRSGGNVATIVTRIVQDVLGLAIISPSEPLGDRGLDSLGMSSILVGIEEEFAFMVAETDITLELFQSVNTLSGYICSRLAESNV
jgi:amino acid adenylation domain-containing protein